VLIEDGKDREISEGLGTIGFELTQLDSPLDAVYLPIGNGALAAGVGSWIKHAQPRCRVIGVCAAGAPAMQLSWRRGQVVSTPEVATIADGIAVREPVPESLPMLAAVVDDILLVSDEAIGRAMRAYWEQERLVAEPSGAVALAAVLETREANEGRRVAAILTGSNLGPEDASRLGL
jgi:threonine dehydratase